MRLQHLGIIGFLVTSLVYAANSYLILLKDHFILERYALALDYPQIESGGIALSHSLHANSLSTLILSLVIFFFGLSFFLILKSKPKLSVKNYLQLFFGLAIIFLASYPSLSSDVFDYNNYNRVQFLHRASPWLYSANTFPQDQTIYFGNWIDRPSVYPTISHAFFITNYLIFGASVPLAIFGFKLLNLVVLATTFFVIYRSVTKPHLFHLIFFNPLIWIEFVGNAHNDLLLGFFVLAGIIYLQKQKLLPAALLLVLSVFTKVTSLLLLPFILFKIFVNSGPMLSFKFAAYLLTFSAAIFYPLSPIFPQYQANLIHQTNLQLRSLSFIIRQLFIQYLGGDTQIQTAQKYQKYATSSLLALAYLFILKKIRQLSFPDLITILFILYLFISSPMLSPWYLGWFLPLIPLIDSNRIRLTAVVFSWTSLISYPMYLVSLYLKPFIGIWQLAMYLAMIAIPLAILLTPRPWYHRLVAKNFKFI